MPSHRQRVHRTLALVVSFVLCFLLLEVALHAMVQPAENAYGQLFGRRLPPLDVVPWGRMHTAEEMHVRRDEWADGLVVDGKQITHSDIGEVEREDAEIGYVPEESYVSTNGWYQNNNLGARSREDSTWEVAGGRKRILVFGDSFAAGWGLPQEETWANLLGQKSDGLDVVNFGVPGYGMGQAFLRYRRVKDALRYTSVFLMLVPTSDLFRDVNTIRSLSNDSWDTHKPNARFALDGDRLVPVPGPYPTVDAMIRENSNGLSDTLRRHLESYEAYYYAPVYAPAGSVLDRSILYKLLLLGLNERHKGRVQRTLMQPGSEAMAINRRIFQELAREAAEDGAELVVILLPRRADIKKYETRPQFRREWDEMTAYFQSGEYRVWNLMDDFLSAPFERLDAAYDHSHYGPVASGMIAEFVWKRVAAPPG